MMFASKGLVPALLLSCALAAGAPAISTAGVPAGALAFLEPVPRLHLVENGNEALPLWAREGVRSAIIVHVDSRHNLLTDRRESDFGSLKGLLAAGDFAGLAAAGSGNTVLSDYDFDSYLAGAWHLGLAREIWWVYPLSREFDAAFLEEMKAFLAERQRGVFARSEIDAFRLEDRLIRGTLNGIPLTISRLEDVPSFTEPVVLDIDCEYFTGPLSADGPRGMKELLAAFRDTLARKRIRVSSALVSYSVEGHLLPLHLKYIGRVLQIWLQHPGEDAAFDVRAWDALWEGERAFFKGEYSYARFQFGKAADNLQAGPYASYYLAVTEFAEDNVQGALKRLDALAQKRPEFALGFITIGDYLYGGLKYPDAVRAYRMALPYRDRGPLLTRRNLGLPGNVLFNAGQYREAIEFYSTLLLLLPEETFLKSYLADAYKLAGEKDLAYNLYLEIWNKARSSFQAENQNFLGYFLELAEERGEILLSGEIRKEIAGLPARARPLGMQ